VADIERRIAAGRLAPGDRLDPVRVVAAALGLAPNTVGAAYRALGERGLVVSQGRRGTFVAARPAVALLADDPVPDGLVDLTSGNPDPAFLPDLGRALAGVPNRSVLYGAPPVDPGLAALLRADLAADGVPVDHLAVVGGALDGIERVLAAHLRPGDRVAVEDPGYASVVELTRAMALRPVPVPVDPFGPDPGGLRAALEAGAAAAVITPRAQNPTGAAIDAGRARELRRVLARFPEVLVVEDDHAGRIAGVPYASVAAGGGHGGGAGVGVTAARWATVRSVAKSLGPDIRLAALVGDELTVQRVAGRQLLGAGWVSHILQRTVAAMLADPDTPALLASASAAYAERRAVVVDALAAAGIEAHGRSGLNVWIGVDDETRVVTGMQRRGYALRAGARFRQASPPGVRISAAMAEPAVLAAAAAALADLLGARGRARTA
jgi:DNA-binding transcriptional MocR family regulator